MERTTRLVISVVALLVVAGAVYWFLVRDRYCDGQGICKVTISVTSWPCTKDTLSVVPDELTVQGGGTPKTIRWIIVNQDASKTAKFVATPNGIVFTGAADQKPQEGEFKTVKYQSDEIQMVDNPRAGHHVYKYAVNLDTSTGACSKDPTIVNNG